MCDSTANLNQAKQIFSDPTLKLMSKCFLDIPESRNDSEHQFSKESHFSIAILDVKNWLKISQFLGRWLYTLNTYNFAP